MERKQYCGRTSLHLPATFGHREVVKLLSEKRGNTEVQDNDGRTPLYWAARFGCIDVVKLLLEKGANLKAETGCGNLRLVCRGHGTKCWNFWVWNPGEARRIIEAWVSSHAQILA